MPLPPSRSQQAFIFDTTMSPVAPAFIHGSCPWRSALPRWAVPWMQHFPACAKQLLMSATLSVCIKPCIRPRPAWNSMRSCCIAGNCRVSCIFQKLYLRTHAVKRSSFGLRRRPTRLAPPLQRLSRTHKTIPNECASSDGWMGWVGGSERRRRLARGLLALLLVALVSTDAGKWGRTDAYLHLYMQYVAACACCWVLGCSLEEQAGQQL